MHISEVYATNRADSSVVVLDRLQSARSDDADADGGGGRPATTEGFTYGGDDFGPKTGRMIDVSNGDQL